MAKRRFRYQPRDVEKTKQRAAQQGGQYDSCYREEVTVWTPKAGDHRVRILPPTWDNAEHYGFDVWIHSSVGPDNQSYLSLQKMRGEPDPIDEAIDRAMREGRGKEKWVDDVKPYRRVLVWVIVRGEEDEGVRLWQMPWTMDRDLSLATLDEDGGLLNIDDPDEGYDVMFTRDGMGMNTKYIGLKIARKPTPLSRDDDEVDKWLDHVMELPLPEVLNFYSYDHIAKVFSGQVSADDGDDADDASDSSGKEKKEPVRTRRRGRMDPGKPKQIDDPDEPLDEESEADPPDEVEQKERATSSGPRRRRAPPSDDPDPEEEEEEQKEAPDRASLRDRLRARMSRAH